MICNENEIESDNEGSRKSFGPVCYYHGGGAGGEVLAHQSGENAEAVDHAFGGAVVFAAGGGPGVAGCADGKYLHRHQRGAGAGSAAAVAEVAKGECGGGAGGAGYLRGGGAGGGDCWG